MSPFRIRYMALDLSLTNQSFIFGNDTLVPVGRGNRSISYEIKVVNGFIYSYLFFFGNGCRNFCDKLLIFPATYKQYSLSILGNAIIGSEGYYRFGNTIKPYAIELLVKFCFFLFGFC